MEVIVFGEKYDSISAALKAFNLGTARYARWKMSFDTPGETIEAMLKKDIERNEKKKLKKALQDAGVTELRYRQFEDQQEGLENILDAAKESKKQREEDLRISKYCEEKGVALARYRRHKDSPEYAGMEPMEIIDAISKTAKAKSREEVEVKGVKYPSVRAFLDAFGYTVTQYNYVRKDCDNAQEAVNILVKKRPGISRNGRSKSITVDGKTFPSVTEFCDFMDISVKSLYDRKCRYGYDDIEECAREYYKLVKEAGGTEDNKHFRRLSVKVNGVVYHGLEDFLSNNDISQKDFDCIKDFYYPDLEPDKWFIVARKFDTLKKKYEKDRKKTVRGKKYTSLQAVCDDYEVSKPQLFWYRDTYWPGSDAWDVIEKYLEYKEEKKGE